MNSRAVSSGVFAALTLIGVSAGAEQLADNGTFAIGIDRVFGFTSDKTSYDANNGAAGVTSNERTLTKFSLLGQGDIATAPLIPRLSFDAFLGPGVTVGGSVMYDYFSPAYKTNGQESQNKTSTGIWLLAPRVGFAKMFTPQIGIWPRAGITYAHVSVENSNTNPANGTTTTINASFGELFFTAEVNLIISPVPHLGFTLGPTLDYLLSYSASQTPADPTPNTNQKEHALGIQAGFFAWF